MKLKTILITGGAGFIGSNFIKYFINKYHYYRLVNVDKLTYAGNLENIKEIMNNKRHIFIKGDITNKELIEFIFKEYDVRGVIHFAAESHVDNSISNPDIFVRTNVYGTFVLLDVAYKYWMEKPFLYRKNYCECRFHHISTDEVYGSLGPTGFFNENSPYAPNSPYSATKAASDMLVRSYHKTYGLNVVITISSNNYGPNQHDEKLIPTIIRNALMNRKIPIYGKGDNIRDWIYVIDHCKAIDLVFHKGKSGETYLIGANNELSNNQIATIICETLDKLIPRKDKKSYKEQISYVEDRPGHDYRYALDSTKIKKELGWMPEADFYESLEDTVKYYIEKYKKLEII